MSHQRDFSTFSQVSEGVIHPQLMVDLATGDDNSKVFMHPLTMQTLKLSDGDIILIKGKKLRDTICRAHVDESCKEAKILMNRVVRCNLRVYLGDSVTVHQCPDVKYGKRVHFLPIHDSVYDDSLYAVSGNLVKGFLKPYFSEAEAYRPVRKGDVFIVRAMRSLEFKVIAIETDHDHDHGEFDDEYCVVAPDTEIFCEGEPVKREKDEAWLQDYGYDYVGGLSKQIAQIRELVELPMRLPNIHKLPKGILLHGPPGCGKKMIVEAIAFETGAFLFYIHGHDLQLKLSTKSVSNLFEKAEKNAPSIIFIDGICHLYRTDEIASELLTLLNGLKSRDHILVIGAVHCPDRLHPRLRTGIFDREIGIGALDEAGRLEVLHIFTKHLKLSSDVDLKRIAELTHGYSGADLTGICGGAILECFKENEAKVELFSDSKGEFVDAEVWNSLTVANEHFDIRKNRH